MAQSTIGNTLIFTGKERPYNRRFLPICSHYLVQPVACTPASGWEKGQVENQVGLVRERFFTPRLKVKSLDELNAWLLDKCVTYATAHLHPEDPGKSIWAMFEAERPHLVPLLAPSMASTACLLRYPKPAQCASTTTGIPSWLWPSDGS